MRSPEVADMLVSLGRLEPSRFRNIVRHLLQFISIRQFPAGERGLPAPTRSRWWIPTAVRVLALLSKCFSIVTNQIFYGSITLQGCHFTPAYNNLLQEFNFC